MKSISVALKQHIALEVTTLATCWKLSRKDGVIIGFTNHVESIFLDDLEYKASTGFTPSAVYAETGFKPGTMEVEGLLSSESISENDIAAGLYDGAGIEVFLVNYEDLSQGSLAIKKGYIGEITIKNGLFVADLKGVSIKLDNNMAQLFTPSCRAVFGDNKCGLDIEAYTFSGSVTGVDSRQSFGDSSRSEVRDYFTNGVVSFSSGANAGLSMEVRLYNAGQFELVLPMPYEIEIGDEYTAIAGCNKSFKTCCDRYNNAINFLGEPHVPGMDRLLETAGTRSEW